MHRVKLHPVRLKAWDDSLGCDRLHLIGYRAECSCGVKSKVKRSRRELRTWQRAHMAHVRAT